MRTARGALTGVVALAAIGLLPAPAAQAAPSVPYTGLHAARSAQPGTTGLDPQTVTVSPSSLDFTNQTLYQLGLPQRVTVTNTGDASTMLSPARVTGDDAANFVVTTDACSGVSLAPGQTCRVEVAAKPTSTGPRHATLELPDESGTSPKMVQLAITNSSEGLRGTYTPVSPQRLLDTRDGTGAPEGVVPAGGVVRLQVTGRGGVPATGASAVVLNVTVVNTQGNGHVTVYPTGVVRPTASSLNYPVNGLRSNSVTVQLGANGQVDIHTNQATNIVADVTGWYASDDSISGRALGGQIHPFEPWRLFDSRSDWGEPLYGGEYGQFALTFNDDVLDSSIRAFIVNITAVNPASRGYLTAWDGVGEPPSTSTVNYFAGTVTPNFAIVPVGPCYLCDGEFAGKPSISVYSSVESHLVIDLVGVVDNGTIKDGLRFEPRAPQRIVDSRLAQGVPGRLSGGVTRTVTVPADVLPADTEALALNVTGVAPTAGTYLKVWPTGVDRPDASTLNLAAGQTAANAALALLGGSSFNQFNIYNNSGSVDVVADVVGTFYLYPGTASGSDAEGLGTDLEWVKPRTVTPRPRKI